MSRYIDADALTWLVEEYKLAISPITEEQERDNRLPLQMLTEFENIIDKQPTVDAVPVVRCKKCRHGTTAHGISDGWVLCTKPYVTDTVGAMMHPNDWFCADGERRTE